MVQGSRISGGYASAGRWGLAAIVSIGLLVTWMRQISEAPVHKDAAQIVSMAINFAHHGVISMSDSAPYTPSDYREPLPVLTEALAASIVDARSGPAEPDAYLSGPRVRGLKYQNIAWLALLSGAAFWAVRVLGGSFVVALVGVVLVNLRFLGPHGGEVNDLLTEIPAAAVLMCASVALSLACTRRKLGWFTVAGLLLGVLALIKAAILYVFIGIVGTWVVVNLWQRSSGWKAALGRELLVLVATFGCVVGPWMYRNLVEIGTFEISQRAGVVLMYRALYDLMTPEEYLGSFYLWAPPGLQAPVGRILHFTPADTQRNGRLQRLNDDLNSDFAADDVVAERAGRPERAISFYWQARAQRQQAEDELSDGGRSESDAETQADKELKSRAFSIFRANPWRHLAAMLPFMWRGAFQTFPVLMVGIALPLWYRRYALAAFALPALGIVFEYALFTHFIPRYDEPANAIARIELLGLLVMLWSVHGAGRTARRTQYAGAETITG